MRQGWRRWRSGERHELGHSGVQRSDTGREASPGQEYVSREEAAPAKAPSGVFNPTRTDLLKQFRLDEAIVRGSGHRLYDAQGREYLDFLSQYGAVPFGQNPPALWEILRRAESEQVASMIQPLIPVDAQRLAERLARSRRAISR